MLSQHFYHIYNRGNNSQNIFYTRENYIFFLNKIKKHFLPHVDVIAYCLMPNHFHILVYTKVDIIPESFGNDLKIMLRSYTRAINKQEGRTGSLFQQHTNKKLCEDVNSPNLSSIEDYPFTCFHYIHQNPLKAGLVDSMENWEMSSYRDYAGFRKGSICNKQIAYELLDIPRAPKEFIEQSIDVKMIKI